VDLEIVGDVAQTLELLNQKFKNHVPHINEEYVHTIRSRQLEDFMAHKNDDTKGTIRPQKILWDVRQVMGPDDILISDVGAHKMWIARYYQCDEPNTCLISNGFCSMGFALPAAIGAKIVHPERKVLAICGDGGFLMNVQELETARRIGANIVVMIWDDQSYGLIEWKQQNTFGRHTDLHFNNPDFIKLAEAFGCKGMRVENSADLHDALKEAFNQDVPVLLSVPVDYRENLKLTQRLGNIACQI
jgi:acetolactate synthase-1/2/3 large subunit